MAILEKSNRALRYLHEVGVHLDAVARKLQVNGVSPFSASHDQLLAALEQKRQAMLVR